MFRYCTSLKSLNLSNFNTSSVTDMSYIFNYCSSLKSLDLSNFDTSSVTDMNKMFSRCSNLESLDISNFNMMNIKNCNDMFGNVNILNYLNIYCSQDKNSCISNSNLNKINELNICQKKISYPIQMHLIIFCSIWNIEETMYKNYIQNINNGPFSICNENFELFYLDKILKIYAPAQNFSLIIDSSSKPKDEFINNMDDFMKDTEPNISYFIKGNDYSAIIKPIIEIFLRGQMSINIDFSNCIVKLNEIYPDNQFRVAQIIIENNNENNLIDQTEYSVYNKFGEKIDLSICKDTNIKIEYSIKNNSLLNIEKILYFRQKVIDIFQIKDNFFNDICYPYYDPNSNSDMILTDRVSDIYQNYSICELGCEYESLNVENMKVTCSCKVRENISAKINEGNFKTYIASSFMSTNFGVIKCYKLVFGIKDKLNNIGFWLFGVMILLNFLLYIVYFNKGITPLKNYINNEMDKNGYKSNKLNNDKEATSKMETIPNEDNKIISYRKKNQYFIKNQKLHLQMKF